MLTSVRHRHHHHHHQQQQQRHHLIYVFFVLSRPFFLVFAFYLNPLDENFGSKCPGSNDCIKRQLLFNLCGGLIDERMHIAVRLHFFHIVNWCARIALVMRKVSFIRNTPWDRYLKEYLSNTNQISGVCIFEVVYQSGYRVMTLQHAISYQIDSILRK